MKLWVSSFLHKQNGWKYLFLMKAETLNINWEACCVPKSVLCTLLPIGNTANKHNLIWYIQDWLVYSTQKHSSLSWFSSLVNNWISHIYWWIFLYFSFYSLIAMLLHHKNNLEHYLIEAFQSNWFYPDRVWSIFSIKCMIKPSNTKKVCKI